jgi:hypothetical protein
MVGVRGSVREKSLAGGGGHGVDVVSYVVRLLRGASRYIPLPLSEGKNPKSPDWAVVAFRRRLLLGGIALRLREGVYVVVRGLLVCFDDLVLPVVSISWRRCSWVSRKEVFVLVAPFLDKSSHVCVGVRCR